MPIVFVTGTDTGCGKTHISCALLHALNQSGQRAVGFKPVASGSEQTAQGLRNEDALLLQQHSAAGFRYQQINPVTLEPAIAPHLAARDAGVTITLESIVEGAERLQREADWVVVEGAGGFLVPLNEQHNFADLLALTRWPTLLVVGMRLGCINHALLSLEAMRSRAPLLGWCANVLPPEQTRVEDNIASLEQRIPESLIGVVRGAEPALAAQELDLSRILAAF